MMNRSTALVLSVTVLLAVGESVATAAPIDYSVSSTGNGFSITGDILTDGTIGNDIPASSVLSWHFVVNDGVHTDVFTPLNSFIDQWSNIAATSTSLALTPTPTTPFSFFTWSGPIGAAAIIWEECYCLPGGKINAIIQDPIAFTTSSSFHPTSLTFAETQGSVPVPEPGTSGLVLGLALCRIAARRRLSSRR